MKLKNKKTGEIGYLHSDSDNQVQVARNTGYNYNYYDTLTELVEEWEDYEEEPKVGYIIDPMEEDCLSVDDSGYEESDVERAKELGIWFETKEEAKRAAKKLKAFKRLEDKGFRFRNWDTSHHNLGIVEFFLPDVVNDVDDYRQDLDLLFGGEE